MIWTCSLMDHERSFVITTHSLLDLAFTAIPCSFLLLSFFYDRERLDDQRLGWRSLIFRVYMYGVQRGRLIDSTNTLHSRIHCVCEDGLYIHVLFLHLH
jgi:hypothetical protein